jgi:hypothetical protein
LHLNVLQDARFEAVEELDVLVRVGEQLHLGDVGVRVG